MKTITTRAVVSRNPNKNWASNAIQFPRLLAELQGHITDDLVKTLAEEMDLNPSDVLTILARADREWQQIKAQL